MEKTAQKKTYKDPALNKIVQEKSQWNREVSALINDIIHFKKSMNGWPSKYYKERTRISQPPPIDLSGILNQLSGQFQDLANQGNSLIQEQANFAKNHLKRRSDKALDKLEKQQGPETATSPTAAPKADLAQQLNKGLAANEADSLIKLADGWEAKYPLESMASNPISRFITRLFTPRIGFGEGARIRQLRMAMLDACVKTYKELKRLHKEIVKSKEVSVKNSHDLMVAVSNHWNIVYSLMLSYKKVKPNDVVSDTGGPIEDESLKREKAIEENGESVEVSQQPSSNDRTAVDQVKDFLAAAAYLGTLVKSPAFHELHSAIESVIAAPKNKKLDTLRRINVSSLYDKALQEVNAELNTQGSNFAAVAQQKRSEPIEAKTAQRQLGKLRHQLLPGATSGQRLEIYRAIDEIKQDLNTVMNLLESGFDQDKLVPAIIEVHREITALRTLIRRLYASVRPEKSMGPFF